MSAATHAVPGPSGRGRLTVVGPLSPIGRIALIVTIVASVAAIVLMIGT